MKHKSINIIKMLPILPLVLVLVILVSISTPIAKLVNIYINKLIIKGVINNDKVNIKYTTKTTKAITKS